MKAIICIEGAAKGQPSSKDLNIRCREGFRRLLEKCGYTGRLPRLNACGSRGSAFGDFKTAHAKLVPGSYVALWIDSEEPLADIERAWDHLSARDKWARPPGTSDDQVLFMTTCMETLIVADRAACQAHYGPNLLDRALPPVFDLENRHRHDVQEMLKHATRDCGNAYAKGVRSFEPLAKLSPATLARHLPSFARIRRILDQKLR